MALGSFTTADGYTLTVFSACYMDYGLKIEKNDNVLFYNPCCLSNESWGTMINHAYDDWDEATEALYNGDEHAFVPWNEHDWNEAIEEQADDLLTGFLYWDD